MTDTNTETTTRKGIPTWVIRGGAILAVWGLIQSPSIWRTYRAGAQAGERMCELVSQGHSPKSAMNIAIEEERNTKYSKRWETFAEMGLKNELESCEPLRRIVLRKTGFI